MIIQSFVLSIDNIGENTSFILSTNCNKQLASINIYYNYYDKNITILNFVSVEQNKGYGSILLNYIMKFFNGIIKTIILDDMSDGYRTKHNIYLKFGFKYIHKDGPEMIYNYTS